MIHKKKINIKVWNWKKKQKIKDWLVEDEIEKKSIKKRSKKINQVNRYQHLKSAKVMRSRKQYKKSIKRNYEV